MILILAMGPFNEHSIGAVLSPGCLKEGWRVSNPKPCSGYALMKDTKDTDPPCIAGLRPSFITDYPLDLARVTYPWLASVP